MQAHILMQVCLYFYLFFHNFKRAISMSCFAGNGRSCPDICCENLVGLSTCMQNRSLWIWIYP